MSALIVLGIIAVCIYHIAKRICQDPKAKQQLQQIFKKVEAKATGFAAIADKFTSLEQVSDALRKSGLESSNLIIGIDYTSSNSSQGMHTFGGKSLHHIAPHMQNPYQQVISIVGRTLEQFDEDKHIPAFGFGDMTTKDFAVFPITPDPQSNRFCYGFDEVLQVYNHITPQIKLSGPTNWAPLIFKAIDIVKSTGSAQYHILIIITDGQVVNKQQTIDAIVAASEYPLSIICIGVGDGPWEEAEEFDDGLPQRKFDNFQFVNYTKIFRQEHSNFDVAFSVAALQEIPEQFAAIKKLQLLGKQ